VVKKQTSYCDGCESRRSARVHARLGGRVETRLSRSRARAENGSGAALHRYYCVLPKAGSRPDQCSGVRPVQNPCISRWRRALDCRRLPTTFRTAFPVSLGPCEDALT
jgi:hypothetical protein